MSQVTLGRGLLATFALIAAASAPAGEPTREGIEFFERKVRPLLVENCHKCHGGEKHKGNLQLTSRANLVKGGDSGPAIVPGQPDRSLLIKAIRYTDEMLRMPPRSKLADNHIADLTTWIKMGAPWSDTARAASGAGNSPGDRGAGSRDRRGGAGRLPRRRRSIPGGNPRRLPGPGSGGYPPSAGLCRLARTRGDGSGLRRAGCVFFST